MYSDWAGPAPYGAGLLIVWLGLLSFLIWRQSNFLKSLFPKSGERDIRKKFEEVSKRIEEFGNQLENLKSKLTEVESIGLKHVQRVELLRYNPYDETGGDQSFTIALLDNEGNGLCLTSLHARSGTRVFAKPVTQGKAGKYQLSKEEEQTVKRALGQSL